MVTDLLRAINAYHITPFGCCCGFLLAMPCHRTCTVWRGGTNPKWTTGGGNSVWLPYSVRPGSNLTLQLSVWDEERSGEDQLIGSGRFGTITIFSGFG